MKYIKIMGLCLVAALALSAVAATAASAKKYGFYKDGTEEAAIGYKYKGKLLSAKGKLVTANNGTIECTGATGSGEVKSLNDAEGEIIFTGCSSSGIKCNSTEPKGASGEIITREITALAALEHVGSEKQPALLFKPLKETTIECSAFQKLKVKNTTGAFGGLLVLIPSNTWLGREGILFDLKYEQTGGVQKGGNGAEFLLEESGEDLKSGVTTTGSGLKNFEEASAEEAELSLEFEKAISIFA